MIEWGESAIGPGGEAAGVTAAPGAAQQGNLPLVGGGVGGGGGSVAMAVEGVAPGSGSEVTILIWQDQGICEIAYVARGTSVGQVRAA